MAIGKRKSTGTRKAVAKNTDELPKKRRTQEKAVPGRDATVSWADLLADEDISGSEASSAEGFTLRPSTPASVTSALPDAKPAACNIVWNENNQVVEVRSPGGPATRIDYDPNTGKPQKIVDGQTGICYLWNGKLWIQSDAPVGELPKIFTSIEVAPNGDITYELSGFRKTNHVNGNITIFSRDGTSRTTDIAGAHLKRDIDQRIAQITYPDGKAIKIEYNEQGGVQALKTATGSELSLNGAAAVTPEGKIVLLSLSGIGEIRRLDGSKVGISPSEVKEAERLRHITDPIDSDEEGVFALLREWSGAQLEVIDAVYWARYGTGLDQELSDELSEEALNQARLLLKRKGFS